MNGDLTIIMLTANRVPKDWAKYHKEKLLEAANGAAIITISSKPLDWGLNLIQEEYGLANLYKQLLRGAKTATTELIAITNDDTLYPQSHFAFRPKEPGFYYNLNRWHLYTWGEPFYFHKPRAGGGLMIATRELVIEAMEARIAADPKLEGLYSVKEIGTSGRMRKYDKYGYQPFYTTVPVVSFYHDNSVDEAIRKHKKYTPPVRALELPLWGRAEDLRKKFK